MLDLRRLQRATPELGLDDTVAWDLDAQDRELDDPDQDQDPQELHAPRGGADPPAGDHGQDHHQLGGRIEAGQVQCRVAGGGLGKYGLGQGIRCREMAEPPQQQGHQKHGSHQGPELRVAPELAQSPRIGAIEQRQGEGTRTGNNPQCHPTPPIESGQAIGETGEPAGGDGGQGVDRGLEQGDARRPDQGEPQEGHHRVDREHPPGMETHALSPGCPRRSPRPTGAACPPGVRRPGTTTGPPSRVPQTTASRRG